MNLTKEEIEAIADRLEEIIDNHFHDAIWDILYERGIISYEPEVSDEDVQKIKEELKRIL